MAFLDDDRLILSLLSVLAAFLLIGALVLINYRRASKRSPEGSVNLNSVKIVLPFGREGVLKEIARLRNGGELNETLIRNLSAEDKVLFEVALIESLSDLPRDEQHLLRATLVRHGFDEQCARRLMKGEISDRIRASTLLDLLRPQYHPKPPEPGVSSGSQNPAKARSATTGGAANHDAASSGL